jgi:hypothetical protein
MGNIENRRSLGAMSGAFSLEDDWKLLSKGKVKEWARRGPNWTKTHSVLVSVFRRGERIRSLKV